MREVKILVFSSARCPAVTVVDAGTMVLRTSCSKPCSSAHHTQKCSLACQVCGMTEADIGKHKAKAVQQAAAAALYETKSSAFSAQSSRQLQLCRRADMRCSTTEAWLIASDKASLRLCS